MIFRYFTIAIAALAAVFSLPAIAAPPLEAYGELPTVEQLALSPDATKFAALTSVDGERVLIVYDNQGRVISRMKVGDLKIRDVEFVTNELVLVLRSSTEKLDERFVADKLEIMQAMLLPVTLDSIDGVFANRRDLVTAIFGDHGRRWINGRPKAYYEAIELVKSHLGRGQFVFDHGRTGLYEVDLITNDARQIGGPPPAGISRDWLVDANGEIIARLDKSATDGSWVIRNTAGSAIASGKDPGGRTGLVTLGKDNSTIIYSARGGGDGMSHWYEVAVDGSGVPEEVFADVGIERLYIDPKTGYLLGYLRDDLTPVLFDKAKESRIAAVRRAFPKLNPTVTEWTEGMNQIVVRTDGNGDSGTYFLVDLAARKADPMIRIRPDIPPADVGSISTVAYSASDGLEMDGILTLPVGVDAKNLPLVMLPHGGPASHDIAGFDWWAQAFASRGYAVFQPNFRGSTNRDEPFVRAGDGEWGAKMQSDISDGLAELAKQGIIDPKRACIVGASYGGYAALAGVTLQNGLYRCAVSVAGVSDIVKLGRTEFYESGYAKTYATSLEQQLGPRSDRRAISPRYSASRADAPILLIHGRDDTVVPYSQSTEMADALKDAGKPYEFVELKGEDHWLSQGETRLAMLRAAVAFVERHNPPN